MNIHDFLEKAVHISEVKPGIPLTEAGSLVIRFCHYPETKYGVVLFSARPRDVEWARDILRDNTEQLLDKFIRDCVHVVTNTEGLSEANKEDITNALHAHFGTWPE